MMNDFIDLIKKGKDDPEYLKSILADDEKVKELQLTSAELDVLKKLDPDSIKTIVEKIEEHTRRLALASTRACSGGADACTGGTQACVNPE